MAEQRKKLYRSPEFKLFNAVQNRLSLYGLYTLLRFVPQLCEMSVMQLGATLGISTKTLQSYLDELESRRLIEQVRSGHRKTVVIFAHDSCDLGGFIDLLCDCLSLTSAATPNDLLRADEGTSYGQKWHDYLTRLHKNGALSLFRISLSDARRLVASAGMPIWKLRRDTGLICPFTGEVENGDVLFLKESPEALRIYHVIPPFPASL